MVELNHIRAWAQIHNVPELYSKNTIITNTAANIGEVIIIDMRVEGGILLGSRCGWT
jgi:hypothetical protein